MKNKKQTLWQKIRKIAELVESVKSLVGIILTIITLLFGFFHFGMNDSFNANILNSPQKKFYNEPNTIKIKLLDAPKRTAPVIKDRPPINFEATVKKRENVLGK